MHAPTRKEAKQMINGEMMTPYLRYELHNTLDHNCYSIYFNDWIIKLGLLYRFAPWMLDWLGFLVFYIEYIDS